MTLTFSNDMGRVVLYGGGGKNFNIISVDGLSFVNKKYTIVKYYGIGGQTTIDETDMSRVITISGDMLYSAALAEAAVRVFSKECTLTFSDSGKKRKTTCKVLDFIFSEKIGKFRKFQLQVECDKPYFTDENPVSVPLFERKAMVTGEMKLPCVFTDRKTCRYAKNGNGAPVYPVIVIDKVVHSGIEGEKFIKITNITTGKELVLNYDICKGEVVEINLEKREITGSVGGNLLNRLGNCYLSEFFLAPGENVITVENHTSGLGNIFLKFDNRYRECVF